VQDIEKIAPKKGVIQQSVKEVVQVPPPHLPTLPILPRNGTKPRRGNGPKGWGGPQPLYLRPRILYITPQDQAATHLKDVSSAAMGGYQLPLSEWLCCPTAELHDIVKAYVRKYHRE